MSTLGSISFYPLLTIGGMQTIALWLNKLARQVGFEVQEISVEPWFWIKQPLVWNSIGEMTHTLRLSHLASKSKCDFYIVHAPAGVCTGPGLTIFHLSTSEYSRNAYSIWNPNRLRLRLINSNLDKLSTHRARKNIAVSHTQATSLRGDGIKIDHVIYNPVAIDRYCPPIDRTELRGQLGIDTNSLVALSVSRYDRAKAWPRILKLVHQFPKVLFYFVGPSHNDIQHLPANCRLFGLLERNEILPLYQAADIFLSLSYAESFGMTFAEALSCGLPCLSTPTGLSGDLLKQEKLFARSTTDFESLNDSKIFRELIDSTSLRAELSNAGREFCVKNLEESKISEAYIQLLLEM